MLIFDDMFQTVFNTVFFITKADESGDARLTIAPYFWYFPVITLPLTVLVFLAWAVWQRWRRMKKREIVSSETASDHRAGSMRPNAFPVQGGFRAQGGVKGIRSRITKASLSHL